MTFSILALKLIKFLTGLLPDFSMNLPAIENIDKTANIFAWVNFFLPTGLIIALLAIAMAYSTFRLVYNVIITTKNLFN